MEIVDRAVGDSETDTGWVAYQKAAEDAPAMFRVHFDTRRFGRGPTTKQKLDYAFDGRWLTVARHRTRTLTHYQVVPEGQQANPMRLAEGPFPLPFGQKARDVLRYYEVSTRPLGPGEPSGTVYLNLKARPEHYRKLDAVGVQVWIDGKTHLPIKLISRNRKKKVTTVTFANVRTNVKIDAGKMFRMPRRLGWTEERVPLERR